ncbi:MAG TPA: hypothetical protein VFL99_04060, partial [Segeticoccus sp.]|nr:hypothetical protein [Segeticoccus sp.]
MFDDQQRPEEEPAADATARLAERRAAVSAAVELLSGVEGVLWQGGTEELTALMDDLGVLVARADAARVAVAAEAQTRGVVAESTAASTAQWVAAHSPHPDTTEGHRIARLAAASTKADNQTLTRALRAGQVSLACADKALKEAQKVAPLVPTASRAEVLGWFLDVAQSGGRKEMDRLSTWVIGRFGGDQLEHD